MYLLYIFVIFLKLSQWAQNVILTIILDVTLNIKYGWLTLLPTWEKTILLFSAWQPCVVFLSVCG